MGLQAALVHIVVKEFSAESFRAIGLCISPDVSNSEDSIGYDMTEWRDARTRSSESRHTTYIEQ
jgi:hypothetical protein